MKHDPNPELFVPRTLISDFTIMADKHVISDNLARALKFSEAVVVKGPIVLSGCSQYRTRMALILAAENGRLAEFLQKLAESGLGNTRSTLRDRRFPALSGLSMEAQGELAVIMRKELQESSLIRVRTKFELSNDIAPEMVEKIKQFQAILLQRFDIANLDRTLTFAGVVPRSMIDWDQSWRRIVEDLIQVSIEDKKFSKLLEAIRPYFMEGRFRRDNETALFDELIASGL